MKKLLSLLLAAALLLGLSVTALAYEDLEPPLWKRWGYDSLEEYLADWDETEEEYAQEVADYLVERAAQDALIASYDPATHDFTPALWEYYGYSSKAEMMELWEIDEAGYAAAVDDEFLSYERRDWTEEQWQAYWAEEEQAMIQETKARLGLVNDVNIIADGAAMQFAAGVPEIRNSCTMAPLADMAAALHAEASWDADTGKITIIRGNTSMELGIGDVVLSFRTAGPGDNVNGGVFYLDSLPYVDGEEVYIPVRAVAEALGYDVEWSSTYRTAVLVDVETLAGQFDAQYSILNAAFGMNSAQDLSRTYQSTGELDVNVSVPLMGSYAGSVSADMVSNASAAQGKVTYDMEQLMGLIVLVAGDDQPDPAELAALTAAMNDGLELIFDMDSMRIYLKGKLFALAFDQAEADADAWYVLDLSDLAGEVDAEALSELSGGTITIGQMLCMIATQSGMDPIYIQETLDEMAEVFAPFSDSHFTGDGNVKSLTYAPEDIAGLTITLNVTMDGDKAAALTGDITYDDDGTKIACNFDYRPTAAIARGSISVAGTVQIDFTLTTATQAVADAAVATAPPAGAKVIDLLEQLYAPGIIVEEVENLQALLAA